MKKPLLLLSIPLSSILFLSLFWSHVTATPTFSSSNQPSNDPFAEPQPIYTNFLSFMSLLNTTTQMVFGPQSCTRLGDPYSPFSSPFRPPGSPAGVYTYEYRIRIPNSFNSEVRVEIFDPDSYNANVASTFTISHTNLAIGNGFPLTTTASCNTSRASTCLVDTGEVTLTTSLPDTYLHDINLFWIKRIDENFSPSPSCSPPGSYNASYNTTTFYQLSYLAETATDTIQIPLVGYTGRPDNSHDTDLRWVAPGAPPSIDQSMPVPTDFDHTTSADGFEISLIQDTPNIYEEPITGDRYLYLSVTTIGGSSKNGFDIWAGPSDAVSTVASEVNTRNLAILNGTGSTYTYGGFEIFAQEAAPQNFHYTEPFTRVLRYFGPAYSGQPITLTLFDIDSGSSAPLNISVGGLTLTYGVTGTLDPDGIPANSRCLPNCNNQFIFPSYVITLPGDLYCTEDNPFCTPFSGGYLIMDYASGSGDNHLISLTAPPEPYYAPEEGCTGFPIGINQEVYSVYPPGTGSGNDYPAPDDFHPSSPQPAYSNFPNNVPNTLLINAQEGYIYKIMVGSDNGSLSWLVWNNGINPNSNTLATSMTWPGNSQDYANHGDGGIPATPLYPHVVRGYVNPLDSSDLALYVGDWVTVHNGSLYSAQFRDVVNGHINNGRILRLPIWNGMPINNGPYTYLPVSGFANFRIQGHNLASSGTSWLLLEFIGWDTSCWQSYDLIDITIAGPTLGNTQTPYTFTASIAPTTLPTPITYTWQAEGQSPIVHAGGITDTISYTWSTAGPKVITATAENFSSSVTTTHTITIVAPADLAIGRPHLITPMAPLHPFARLFHCAHHQFRRGGREPTFLCGRLPRPWHWC